MPQAKKTGKSDGGRRWFHDAGDPEGTLGTAIKLRRTELGLSRRELAERAGLSYPYLAELENGAKRGSPRALEAIAEALDLRPSELLAWSDDLAESRGTSPSDPQHWRHRPAASPAPAPSVMTAPLLAGGAPMTREAVRQAESGRRSPRMVAAEITELLRTVEPDVAEEALLLVLGEQRLSEATSAEPKPRRRR